VKVFANMAGSRIGPAERCCEDSAISKLSPRGSVMAISGMPEEKTDERLVISPRVSYSCRRLCWRPVTAGPCIRRERFTPLGQTRKRKSSLASGLVHGKDAPREGGRRTNGGEKQQKGPRRLGARPRQPTSATHPGPSQNRVDLMRRGTRQERGCGATRCMAVAEAALGCPPC
jgi:hypothetical protein